MFSKKGFTLIELLIVITIIGILAVAFLPTLLNAPARGRDTQRMADLNKFQKALAVMAMDGLTLPNSACIGDVTDFNAADFSGAVPTAPTQAALTVDDQTCADDYIYINAPSDDYSFGLYTRVENLVNANATCSTLEAEPIVLAKPGAEAEADEYCYAILTQ